MNHSAELRTKYRYEIRKIDFLRFHKIVFAKDLQCGSNQMYSLNYLVPLMAPN